MLLMHYPLYMNRRARRLREGRGREARRQEGAAQPAESRWPQSEVNAIPRGAEMRAASRPGLAPGKEAMPWGQRAGWIALHFREPGLRLFGDLRTAVANGAAAVGVSILWM
ncbi:Protein of unknown function [Gryllus bimaculatus]|nr:Protein of unknown function [Gryllus bimaculatus]